MRQTVLFMVFEGNRRILDDMVNGHRRVPDAPPLNPPSSKPTLGFPLGTALILFIVFGVSTLFSCCYHWEKIRSHTSRFTSQRTVADASLANHPTADAPGNVVEMASGEPLEKSKCSKQALSLPVMMPGDEIPKYVAWPSPHGSLNVPGSACPSQPVSPVTKDITGLNRQGKRYRADRMFTAGLKPIYEKFWGFCKQGQET